MGKNDYPFRKKRSDTLVRTLRRVYGDDFAAGTRSDAKLGTVLENSGVGSLSAFRKIGQGGRSSMRYRNTTSEGGSWDDRTLAAVWNKGRVVSGYDPAKYRKDAYGSWIARSEHGVTSRYGWEVDHVTPVSRGGSDMLSNLQPLYWENNRSKGDS